MGFSLLLSVILVFGILGAVVFNVAKKLSEEMLMSAIHNLSKSLDLVQGTVEAILSKEAEFQKLIAQELGLAPEVCVYLGDTSVDMRTAVAAGMHPVGVTWGFRTPEELTRSGAARLIAHPMELMDFVTLL